MTNYSASQMHAAIDSIHRYVLTPRNIEHVLSADDVATIERIVSVFDAAQAKAVKSSLSSCTV